MRIRWVRILVAAVCSELLIFSIYCLALRYARSVLEPIAFLDFFGVAFLAGLWVTFRIRRGCLLHGTLVGVTACVLYVVGCLPWILNGQLPFDYGIGALQSFAIQIPGSALGGYVGRQFKKKSHA